jgi:putative hydrolase of the HAD superfamily
MISAVLFDFGGVILSSPFEAFRAYEERAGLPVDIIRTINSTDPDANAWARLERSEIDVATFVAEFEREAAALGHRVDGTEVISCLRGELRPEMVEAVRRCKERHDVALLTNNIVSGDGGEVGEFAEVVAMFDVVIESSVVGCRKPETRFYEIALEALGIEADQAVFLDDLGINLKPAKALGMTTIKVGDPSVALDELETVLGIPLR